MLLRRRRRRRGYVHTRLLLHTAPLPQRTGLPPRARELLQLITPATPPPGPANMRKTAPQPEPDLPFCPSSCAATRQVSMSPCPTLSPRVRLPTCRMSFECLTSHHQELPAPCRPALRKHCCKVFLHHAQAPRIAGSSIPFCTTVRCSRCAQVGISHLVKLCLLRCCRRRSPARLLRRKHYATHKRWRLRRRGLARRRARGPAAAAAAAR